MKQFYSFCLVFLLTVAGYSENGRLTVTTEPSGAKVYYSAPGEEKLDFLGETPINYVEFPEGIYQFLITLPDYDSIKIEELAIFPGGHKKVFREFTSSYAFLQVNSKPDSSILFLDDVKIGQCPYTNTLVLPGVYLLTIAPRDSLYKPSKKKIQLGKQDSLNIKKQHLFRSKTFLPEHLSIPPWRIQFEAGFQRLAHSGEYDAETGADPRFAATGGGGGQVTTDSLSFKSRNFPSDSVKTSILTPLVLRLGLPNDIEFHLHLPFSSFSPSVDSTGEFGPGDLILGAKYTLRKHKVGFNASYKFNNGSLVKDRGSGYKSLRLSAMGMLLKKKFQLYGNAGYEFRFTLKGESDLNKGDDIFAYLQAGYLMHPWTPYLALRGDYFFADMWKGNESFENGGHLLAPEVGVTVDATESFGLQAGIPFTVLGKNSLKHWGVHLSLAYSIGVN
ncbi:transporter [Fibrobacterota bacterium]